MRLVACSITARTWAWVPPGRPAVNKPRQDRLGLAARELRQAGPVRRGARPVPAFVRVSHTVDAAIFTPRPASSP